MTCFTIWYQTPFYGNEFVCINIFIDSEQGCRINAFSINECWHEMTHYRHDHFSRYSLKHELFQKSKLHSPFHFKSFSLPLLSYDSFLRLIEWVRWGTRGIHIHDIIIQANKKGNRKHAKTIQLRVWYFLSLI